MALGGHRNRASDETKRLNIECNFPFFSAFWEKSEEKLVLNHASSGKISRLRSQKSLHSNYNCVFVCVCFGQRAQRIERQIFHPPPSSSYMNEIYLKLLHTRHELDANENSNFSISIMIPHFQKNSDRNSRIINNSQGC